ncbi:MAG: EamA family transporter, partial [Pseudomonadota bacterium]
FIWFYEGVKYIGAARTSVYINLVPVFGVLLSAITIGERPHLSLYAGGALILVGLAIVNYFHANHVE